MKIINPNIEILKQVPGNVWSRIFKFIMVIGLLYFCFSIFGIKAWAEAKISRIDFEDASVINVVQTLAKSVGFDLVLSGDQGVMQNKRATIHLKDVTIEEAIDYILRTNGFNYERRGKVLLVSTLPQDLVQTAYKAEVKVFSLKYLSASKASELLSKIIPSASFQVGGRAHALIVRGKDSEIKDMEKLIASIDKPTPQILIESKVVEISRSDSMKLGISYGNGIFKFVTNKESRKTELAEDIVSSLNTMVAEGRANVVANPRIATLDNQEALINIGSRIPYAVPVTSGSNTQWTVDYIDAGVKLKITPQLGDDGDITTFIQPEVSSISEWRTTAAGDFPVISTRNASATVRIKNGDTIVVGGLLSEVDRENITKIPILGYLPGLGLLFQNRNLEKEKTEIVFLITPHVI